MPEESPRAAAWKSHLLYAAPLLLLLLAAVLPLVRGTETLILRDVLNSHFPMKWSQAEAMRGGDPVPLIDPYRAGGQPLAGNLNASPFYPDNLLLLVGSPFWGFNARFWLHLLVAPLAFYWMARSWWLGREAAWAGAACWTVSGFYLSHLNFYNLIPGVTLAPALAAACLDFARGRRRALMTPVIALLWALMVLGGDPLMAALAGLLAATALLLAWRERPAGTGTGALALLAAAFVCGTLIALPQIVEFLRILPGSFRGFQGYGPKSVVTSSLDPRQAAEWLLPLAFGRPDVLGEGAFWGNQFFTGVPPYYLSLYPGLLCLALLAAAGRPQGRAAGWAVFWIAFGLFFSLGKFNPVAEWLFLHQKSFRYPVKFWLPAAAGLALLCGIGFEKLRLTAPRRRFGWTLLALGVAFGAFWAFLTWAPGLAEQWLDLFIPRPAPFLAAERARWAGLALASLGVLAALGAALWVFRRRSWVWGGALLVLIHAASQLWLLRPLYPTDAVTPYLVPPPALAHVPKDARVVNPDYNYLFGPSTLRQGRFPEPHIRWMERRSFYELYPFSGPVWSLRYDLNTSPEGLDTYLTRRAQIEVMRAKDPERVRLLAAWGVGRLVMNHPLEPAPPGARRLAAVPSFGRELYLYEVTPRAPEVFLAKRVFREKDFPAVYKRLTAPGFDPRTDAAIVGKAPSPWITGGGTVRILERAPESLAIETQAGPGGALLVIQRADLLFQAEIDGRPAEIVTANAHRMGIEVPAGRHQVRLRTDRRPLYRSLVVATLGLLLLPGLAWWGRRNSGFVRI